MTSIAASTFALLLATQADPDGPKQPPTPAELAAISERGKNLAGYDNAAWHASDAIQARKPKPKPGTVAGYIARKGEAGWVVAFGRLDEAKKTFLVAAEAKEDGGPDRFSIEAFDPPRADTGYYRSASLAIEAAIKDFTATFEGERRPYNVAVLPADQGQLWVYLVPAPTKPRVWPLGGDVRYLASPDGTKVVAKRQLHKAVIENQPPPDDGQKRVAGMHNHILSETPEDTDVFHVLSRKPSLPEFVGTEHFTFLIDPDGQVKYVGKAGELPKPK